MVMCSLLCRFGCLLECLCGCLSGEFGCLNVGYEMGGRQDTSEG